jgi:UDP-glucose:glycoprotein glucosyltransferase
VLGETEDTITMANLGYIQLKANPGVQGFRIRGGRSSEVYEIDSIGGSVVKGDDEWSVAVVDFEGPTLFPVVKRKVGMEDDDVLVEGKEDGSWWDTVFGSKPEVVEVVNADINIFSVASGHLYERFLSIMMLSVMRHTNSTVKFWLIEDFLSPSFKQDVPVLAATYGFQYEFVTYKWPGWLRSQTEKQRTIWGYKILFLDVLFPLSLDKVIFVDADQIVRTDMKELVDIDLNGCVYGYVLSC